MIDLHSHTVHSDGSSTVSELLNEAQKKQLSIISITDHNTINAYEELKEKTIRKIYDGRIITGVEITTTYKGEVIEVLGYNFDLDIMRDLLSRNVLTFEQKQLKEFALIQDRYNSIGIKFDKNNIIFDPTKESCRLAFRAEIKKYQENIPFFLSEESLTSEKGFARNEVYNPKSLLYVDESSLYPSLEKTIEIIHQAGGYSFLAHTFVYSPNIIEQLGVILQNYALNGLECYYTTFTKEQTEYLLNICDQFNLFKSGGSDFHGTRKKNHFLGIGDGSLLIDDTLISNWDLPKKVKK